MTRLILSVITIFSFTVLMPPSAYAQTNPQLKKERIQASYLLAIGRLPTTGELDWWSKQNDYTVAQLVETHRTYMNRTSPGSKDEIIKKSYFIAFGRDAHTVQPGEVNHWKGRSEVFWETFPYHVRFLSDNLRVRPDIYEDVIKNGYLKLFNKTASTAEINKWKGQPVKSFAELIFLLYKNPPPGYSIDPMALITAMKYYSDFSNISFSDPVTREIVAITGGNDLYNKFKNLR